MANTDLNPQGGIQGTSPLYRFGTTPNTRSVISQRCRVLTPAYGGDSGVLYQMGVLSSFTTSQSRTVEAIGGIGFGDQIAELVPGMTDAQAIDFTRSLLYLSNLWQSTGYAAGVSGPVRSLKHHRWPFDIRQEVVFSSLADQELSGGTPQPGSGLTGGVSTATYEGNLGGSNVDETSGTHNILVTFYEGCWFTSWDQGGFEKDSALISESGNAMVTDVHDGSSIVSEFAKTGNDPSQGQYGSIIYNGSGF